MKNTSYFFVKVYTKDETFAGFLSNGKNSEFHYLYNTFSLELCEFGSIEDAKEAFHAFKTTLADILDSGAKDYYTYEIFEQRPPISVYKYCYCLE